MAAASNDGETASQTAVDASVRECRTSMDYRIPQYFTLMITS
jgi:hypothetical protein